MSKAGPQLNNIPAEEATLGSFLIDPEAFLVVDGLHREHFFLLKHQLIFEAMQALNAHEKPLDVLTVASELQRRGVLEQVGGVVYLSQLISAVPSAVNVSAYIAEVQDSYKRRKTLELLQNTARLAAGNYGLDDIAEAAQSITAQLTDLLKAPSQTPTFQSFAEIAPGLEPITWLWPGWIPRGMITLLGAVPGAGKSMIALDLAKRIIHGESFPDGKAGQGPNNVIYVDAELVPQILKERAEAWKMDTSRLFLMLPRPNDAIDFGRDEYRAQLRQMTEIIKPSLIIIDSLSRISSKGENNIEDIRGILAFLNEVASTYSVGLLLIHHLRKRGSLQMSLPEMDVTIDDFRGSSHIIAMARSVLALSVVQDGADINRNGPRKLQSVKSNVGAYPEALGCEFLPLYPAGVFLKWSAQAPQPYRAPTTTDKCLEWLLTTLEAGPLSLSELVKLGEPEGFSKVTIWRARQEAKSRIGDTDGRQSPTNKWQLLTM